VASVFAFFSFLKILLSSVGGEKIWTAVLMGIEFLQWRGRDMPCAADEDTIPY
jgi:hypothetical protein